MTDRPMTGFTYQGVFVERHRQSGAVVDLDRVQCHVGPDPAEYRPVDRVCAKPSKVEQGP
jgi:hypothetical protein